MSFDKSDLDRLMIAKTLLDRAANIHTAEPDDHTLAIELLACHDASELVLATIASRLPGAKLKDQSNLLSYAGLIGGAEYKEVGFPGGSHWDALNRARNALKHGGLLPNQGQFRQVTEETRKHLNRICKDRLGEELDALDLSALIHCDSTKAALREIREAIKAANEPEDYKRCLERMACALHTAFEEHSALPSIAIGKPSADDALMLAGYGIHSREFLTLQQYLPKPPAKWEEEGTAYWDSSKYGHPANWTREAANFCLRVCIEVIVKTQVAPDIPMPLQRDGFYMQRITAIEDGVKVWEANLSFPVIRLSPPDHVPPVVRVLAKGDSIIGRVRMTGGRDQGLRESLHVDQLIKVWFEDGSTRPNGGYVDASKVEVVCVPILCWQELLPDRRLPEFPWELPEGWEYEE